MKLITKAFINVILLVLTGCTTGMFASIPEESGSIDVFFCDQVDCMSRLLDHIGEGSSCAFYHIDQSDADKLLAKDAILVVDSNHPIDNAIVESGSALMHDKFCVWDDFVWTGSWNPAQGLSIPNNAVLIESRTLARAFKSEFNEFQRSIFHRGTSNPGIVKLNGQLTEVYFCPEDDCKKQVMSVLRAAKSSVHFMTFSFTDDDIGDLLVKKEKEGIEVKGVFDSRKDKYSEYEKLKEFSSISKVHHKVFIVDGHTVVTGSFNPSKNGNERNDENIIIIRDENIAGLFEKEFNRLFD